VGGRPRPSSSRCCGWRAPRSSRTAETFAIPPTLLPAAPTLEHFSRPCSRKTNFVGYFINSAIVATATTALVIVVACSAAYSLVRFRFFGRRVMAQLVLFTYLLPAVVLLLPIYLLLTALGLANSLLGLVVTYTTFALPFSLWLLRSFIAAIPIDLEEAAMVDGATRMQAFARVVLPRRCRASSRPPLFSFILAWNEYLYALVSSASTSARP